jgi:8-oxo-dGTP diphosphatase
MLGLSEFLSTLPKKYDTIVVDAFLFDDRGRVLMQRRSMDRKLFPGYWDAIGGHLEPGESIEECLRREIREETSMELTRIYAMIHRFERRSDSSAINLQFVAQAEGTPVPELGKVTELRWVDETELPLLKDALTVEMREGALAALKYIRDMNLRA